jgi:glycosyltransferase involved in cell wall biosynthesis
LYTWNAAWRLRNRPRLIVSNNTTIFHSVYHNMQMLVYAPVFRRFDTLVYGTELQRNLWNSRYGLTGTDSRVIYNGIDTSHFTPPPSVAARNTLRARYHLDPEVLCLGCVAQFRTDKSHGDLVAALERSVARGIPCHLLLVGDGPTRPVIEKLVAARGLQDRVTFLGSQQDVRDALAVMDIFILASIETFSNAALEAMAMQKAVILSRIGGGPEMLGGGESGILYTPGNVDELAAAIQKLAGRETRERYAANARARVCEHFSFERMVQDYVAAFTGGT